MVKKKLIFEWALPGAVGLAAMILGVWLRNVSSESGSPLLPRARWTRIETAAATYVFDTRWTNFSRPRQNVDPEAVSNWILDVSRVRWVRQLKTPPQIAKSDDPLYRLKLNSATNQSIVVSILGYTPRGEFFARVNERYGIISAADAKQLVINDQSFIQRHPFQEIHRQSLRRLIIRSDRQRLELTHHPITGLWFARRGTKSSTIIDGKPVDRLLNAIQSMSIGAIIPTPDGQRIAIDFDAKQISIITSSNLSAVLGNDGCWYTIYSVVPLAISEIKSGTHRPRLILKRDAIDSMALTTSSNSVILSKNARGHWKNSTGQVRTIAVNNLCVNLERFKPSELIPHEIDSITLRLTQGRDHASIRIGWDASNHIAVRLDESTPPIILTGNVPELIEVINSLNH